MQAAGNGVDGPGVVGAGSGGGAEALAFVAEAVTVTVAVAVTVGGAAIVADAVADAVAVAVGLSPAVALTVAVELRDEGGCDTVGALAEACANEADGATTAEEADGGSDAARVAPAEGTIGGVTDRWLADVGDIRTAAVTPAARTATAATTIAHWMTICWR